MIADLADPDAQPAPDYDVCIAGAGAAGISIALRLAGSGVRVGLFESGGRGPEHAVQDLYRGESVGLDGAGPGQCRLRYFGGTTNHWAGWCAPLEASDFELRHWVPDSGWPIGRADLDPYYPDAAALCELGSHWADTPPVRNGMPAFDESRMVLRGWRYSPPTRFGSTYSESLGRAEDVDVFLNANLVRIATAGDGSRVTALEFATFAGRRVSVEAGAYVLACGGLENARLLLAARDVRREGLGNGSGLVGRHFMQHPERVVGRLLTDRVADLARAFERAETPGGGSASPFIAITPRVREHHRLLNCAFEFFDKNANSESFQALRGIWLDASEGKWPTDLDDRLYRVFTDLDGLATDLGARISGEPAAIGILMRSEQLPNADSRVYLTDSLDPFGVPRLAVDWRLTSVEKRSIVTSTTLFAAELARMKLGRVQLASWLEGEAWPDPIWSGCHHMGTTRMAADPAHGVVNGECRVHEVANLWIAGSSVFPTGGYVPPTLTIVALALRLADALRAELA